MPTRILRPNADDKADWTEVPAGAAWTVLDDDVLQPNGNVGGDYVFSSTNGQVNRQAMESFVLEPGEVITRLRAWAYVQVNAGATLDFWIVDSSAAAKSYPNHKTQAGTFNGWISVDYTGQDVTQVLLDALELNEQVLSATGPQVFVFVHYIEVTTTAPAPSQPDGFRATPVDRDGHTTLSCNPAGGYVDGYLIVRNGVQVYDGPVPSFTDTLAPNDHVQYQMVAYNETDVSGAAKTETGDIMLHLVAPPPRPALTATRNGDAIDLTWATAFPAFSARIYRNGVLIHDGAEGTYSDPLPADATAAYSAITYNDGGESAPSPLAWVGDRSGTVLDAVSTADAAPGEAPYRISDLPGHDTASVRFTPRAAVDLLLASDLLVPTDTLAPDTGDSVIHGWIARLGGIDAHTGIELAGAGSVVGPGMKIGARRTVGRYSAPLGEQIETDITYAELPSLADGPEQINVYTCRNGEGWS